MASALRSLIAIAAGLLLITLVVETIEFGVVTMALGRPSTDPVIYFGTRNRPWILALKLIYNTAAATLGGYVTARVAGRAPVAHGAALMVVQTIGFGYALATPELRQWTPLWMWLALIVVSAVGIMGGARLAKPANLTGTSGSSLERGDR